MAREPLSTCKVWQMHGDGRRKNSACFHHAAEVGVAYRYPVGRSGCSTRQERRRLQDDLAAVFSVLQRRAGSTLSNNMCRFKLHRQIQRHYFLLKSAKTFFKIKHTFSVQIDTACSFLVSTQVPAYSQGTLIIAQSSSVTMDRFQKLSIAVVYSPFPGLSLIHI